MRARESGGIVSKAAAVEQCNAVSDRLRELAPKLADLMDAAREDVLAHMDRRPAPHWPQIHSTPPSSG